MKYEELLSKFEEMTPREFLKALGAEEMPVDTTKEKLYPPRNYAKSFMVIPLGELYIPPPIDKYKNFIDDLILEVQIKREDDIVVVRMRLLYPFYMGRFIENEEEEEEEKEKRFWKGSDYTSDYMQEDKGRRIYDYFVGRVLSDNEEKVQNLIDEMLKEVVESYIVPFLRRMVRRKKTEEMVLGLINKKLIL